MRNRRLLAAVSLGFLTIAAGCTTTRAETGTDPATGECATGLTSCAEGAGQVCANLFDNVRHCGACGNFCGVGASCVGGSCTGGDGTGPGLAPNDAGSSGGDCNPPCSAAARCCVGSCVNRSADRNTNGRTDVSFSNCNGCGIACDAERANACATQLGGGSQQCACGNFAQCSAGQLCVQRGTTFVCTDLNNDPLNCGELGNECQSGESCLSGVCRCGSNPTCGSGFACCSSACIPSDTDPNNCGACGNVCSANAPDCVAGACTCGGGAACSMGDGLIDLGSSCCTGSCIPNSDTSCGCTMCSTADGETCAGALDLLGGGMPTGEVCCSALGGLDCGFDLGGLPI